MAHPLMPKATAVWLVDNTALTFDQISEFTGLHMVEIRGIADGEVATGIQGLNPINNGQLTAEMIAKCEANPKARLQLSKPEVELVKRPKGPRYTPLSKRGDKPDAISWMVKEVPGVTDQEIVKLIGTTKATIEKIRTNAHWNSPNLKPTSPVLLGLCSGEELSVVIENSKARIARDQAVNAGGIDVTTGEQAIAEDENGEQSPE